MTLFPRVFAAAAVLCIGALLLPPGLHDARAQSSDATALYPQKGFATASGQHVYQAVCQGCHMPSGTGAQGRANIRRWPATPNSPPRRTSP